MKLFRNIDFEVAYKINDKKHEAWIRFHHISKWFKFKHKIQFVYLIPINLLIVLYKYFIFSQATKYDLLYRVPEVEQYTARVENIRTSYAIQDPAYFSKYIAFTESDEHKQFFITQGKRKVLDDLFKELEKYVDIKVENREWEGRYIITAEIKIVKTNENT